VCLISAIRWVIVATSDSVGVMVAVQALHFFTFGVWFSLAIRLLGRFAPLERRATVQGVFSAACFGIGGAFGSFSGGALMEYHGGDTLFLAAAVAELVAMAVFVVALSNRRLAASAG
jgi:predicted MFS family arabinose efflux permease